MTTEPLRLVVELVRAEQAGEPYGFRFAPQEYLVRGAGGGFASGRLAWDHGLLADLAALRQPGCDPVIRQRLGELLRGFLAAASWGEQEALISAAIQQQQRVLLTLRFAAAELYALPWELLTLRATGQHLGELPQVLLRYEWPETHPTAAAARGSQQRILLAWSAAGGAVPAAEHTAALQSACAAGSYPFSLQQDVLPHTSYAALHAALAAAAAEERPIAVLHLLCHGAAAGTSFGLMLDGDEVGAGPVVVDAGRLRQLLAPHAAMVRLVVLAACDSGNSGALGSQLGSVAQALHRAGVAAVVASRYPLSAAGSIRLSETLYQELLGRPAALETALLAARARLATDAARLDWASLQLYAHSAAGDDTRPLLLRPYRGLLPFLPPHHQFFFGRAPEVAEICGDLAALATAGKPRMLVVAGASGAGKSSVVLAGAVPRLRALWPGLRLCTLRPGSEPEAALSRALATDDATDAGGPLLLIVDQLEELFTHCEDPAARQRFVAQLWQRASEPAGRTHIIVTLRVDFLGRCGELVLDERGLRLDTVAYDEAHRVFIAQLGAPALRAVISEPARAVGLVLEEGLVSRLVLDVGAEPGALPLLEDTLDLLWQRRSGCTLTQAAYDEVGGVTGALRGRADALVDALDPSECQVARRLLLHLVNIAEDITLSTRRRVALALLRPREPEAASRFDRVLLRLVEARLLVCDGEGEQRTAEVAHEALLRKWPRLHEWVREDRKMLVELEKIEAWVRQCAELQTLLVRSQLDRVAQFQQEFPHELPSTAVALLATSEASERRRARVRSWTYRLIVLSGLVFALLGWFGLRQASLANQQARAVRDVARMSAVRAFSGDPAMRAALLREFEADDLTRVPGWRAAASAVVGDLLRVHDQWSILDYKDGRKSAVSSDCVHAVTVAADFSVWLWERDKVIATLKLPAQPAPPKAVALSPDRRSLLIATTDDAVHLWRLDGQPTATPLAGSVGEVSSVGFSPDGKRLFVMSRPNTVRQWPGDGTGTPTLLGSQPDRVGSQLSLRAGGWLFGGRQGSVVKLYSEAASVEVLFDHKRAGAYSLATTVCDQPDRIATVGLYGAVQVWMLGEPPLDRGLFVVPLSGVQRARYSRDGKRFALGTKHGVIEIWNSDGTGAPLRMMGADSVGELVFSPDGRRLYVGFSSGVQRVFNFDAGGEIIALPTTLHEISSWSTQFFSPDGKQLVTRTADGHAWLVSTETGTTLATLSVPGQLISHVVFSPDGSQIIAQLNNGTLRVWPSSGQGEPVAVQTTVPSLWTFTADGKRLIMRGPRLATQIWNLNPNDPPSALRAEGLAFQPWLSPNGALFAEPQEGTLRIARTEDQGARPLLLKFDGYLDAVSWSSDGLWLMTRAGSRDVGFKVLRIATDGSRQPVELPLDNSNVYYTVLSPDGTSAITGAPDETASVWQFDKLARLDPKDLRRQLWNSDAPCMSGADVEAYGKRPRNAPPTV